MVPGHEQANARMTPDGGLEIRVGVAFRDGQGLETTLAQVAHEILGSIRRRCVSCMAITAITPYSTGTWGSRSDWCMAGGAVGTACAEIGERAKRIGAKLLQLDPAMVTLRDGRVLRTNQQHRPFRNRTCLVSASADLPPDVDPAGLETTSGYKPQRDSGTFSLCGPRRYRRCRSDLGDVEILDYVHRRGTVACWSIP